MESSGSVSVNGCPKKCGYKGELREAPLGGGSAEICPECLAVIMDGGHAFDSRKKIDIAAALQPALDKIRRENFSDPLTSIRNRRFFFNRLNSEILAARHRHFISIAGIFFDLDDIYQRIGSRGGDVVVQSVAAGLVPVFRASDDIARVEPSVFGLILKSADEVSASAVAQRIIEALGDEFHDHSGKSVKVHFGFCVHKADEETGEESWGLLMKKIEKERNKK